MAENHTVTYTVSIAMEIPAPPRSAAHAVLEFWRRLRSDDGNDGVCWRFEVEVTDERGTEAYSGPVVLGVPDIRRFEDRYQQAASRAGKSSHDEDAPSAPHVHFHYGSGMHGFLYDYGPEISTSIEEAVDDLATVFELEDGQRHELTERRLIALGGGYGADYAEITPCNEPECPDYLYYVRQIAG